MPFKKILVALDGSKYSQTAADYAFSLAVAQGAQVSGQHVVDPRVVDLFLQPEFAAELGFSESLKTADKVFAAVRKIGKLVLDLFASEAVGRALKVHTFLDEGYVLDEILKRSEEFDLTVIGHRGRGERRFGTEGLVGAIAERVAAGAKSPVLIAVTPWSQIKEIIVAYDGSEPSIGALLMSEELAKALDLPLYAVHVVDSPTRLGEAHLTVEQGYKYLREKWEHNVFQIREGKPTPTILSCADQAQGLLVLGAYGFRNREDTVLGSTATTAVRRSKSSVLIYR